MKKQNLFVSFAVHAAMAACAYAWFSYGSDGAANVFLAACWFFGLAGVVAGIFGAQSKKEPAYRPEWFDYWSQCFSVMVAVFLAYQGYFWCMAIFVVGMIGANVHRARHK